LKASATNDVTGRWIAGSRKGNTDVSIWISGRKILCPAPIEA
jgi:hypothetical protein